MDGDALTMAARKFRETLDGTSWREIAQAAPAVINRGVPRYRDHARRRC